MKKPFLSVMVLTLIPVSVRVTLTIAPGSMLPLLSLTTPLIWDVAWAQMRDVLRV